MIEHRRDLTAWVMHFVHKRNTLNDPAYELNEGSDTPLFPFTTDREKNRRFEFWNIVEDSHTLAADEDAFNVLLKIIEDGHIRSGWSFRSFKPTIYGPRSACCLTEMPLYALLEYAKIRSPDDVGTYAICLLRDELFAAGGRPVIYGLSGSHLELPRVKRGIPMIDAWPRMLDPACGISELEQYRYVSMNLGGKRRIDWGHEREWRWADVSDACSCPGLPIWLADEPYHFSRVALIVSTDQEADKVLNKLKELHDAGAHNFGYGYNRETLAATEVISLERALSETKKGPTPYVRLEDISSSKIRNFDRPKVSKAFKASVKQALKEAHSAADAATANYLKREKAGVPGYHFDGFGFAHLVVRSSQSPLITALLELGETSVIGGVGYWVSNFTKDRTGQLSVAEAAVTAAMKVLSKHFPDEIFQVETRWD